MYNLRYHIASLVSVFLALAIGLILGGLAVNQGAVDRQEKALVEGLQKEFTQLRSENAVLAAENDALDAFAADSIEAWAVDRLRDRVVLVVANAGREDGIADCREAVEDAGGSVALVTLLKPRFGLDDDKIGSELATLVAGQDPEQGIAASLAAEWAGPAPRPLTDRLVAAGVIRMMDVPVDSGVSSLVNVAAVDGKPDSAAIAVARAFRTSDGLALGAETPGSGTGVARASADADLAAFDTLGTQIGRYTLIALLSGGQQGYYGTSDGVDGVYPPVPAP